MPELETSSTPVEGGAAPGAIYSKADIAVGYDTWEELLEAEANGFAVAIILRKPDFDNTFVRLVGPFATHREARNKSAVLRKRVRNWIGVNPAVVLVGVHVQPLWKDLR